MHRVFLPFLYYFPFKNKGVYMQKKFIIGMVDYENLGRKSNKVEIDVSFDGERFSASGGIWNSRKSDYVCCGQMLEEILELFPENQLVQRIVKVWRKYHLNDMTAGSPKQMAFLDQFDESLTYDLACQKLADAGLNPDEDYLINDMPYSYGSSWLNTSIPDHIQSEILSWESEVSPDL
jgi:hypothetical protein